MRRRLTVATLVAALMALGGTAEAGTKQGLSFDLTYTSKSPGKATGLKTRISGGPSNALGVPFAARTVIIRFSRGTRFNTGVPARCTKRILDVRGPRGCPRRSIVGTGEGSAVTGLAVIDPVEVDITAFNRRNGILFYVAPAPGEVGNPFVISGRLRGTRLSVQVPRLPQPTPFGEAILTRFDLDIRRINRRVRSRGRLVRRPYVTTPGTCRRRWTARSQFRYDAPQNPINISSSTTCRRR